MPDEILARLPANNGVCMVTFVPQFVSQECRDWDRGVQAEMERRGMDREDYQGYKAVREELAAASSAAAGRRSPRWPMHIEHVREAAGADHIGIGSDFDGTADLPEGLGDVSCYPALFAELLDRWLERGRLRPAGRRQRAAGDARSRGVLPRRQGPVTKERGSAGHRGFQGVAPLG